VKPLIAVTIGDAAGVSADILLRSLKEIRAFATPVAYANHSLLAHALADMKARTSDAVSWPELIVVRDASDASALPADALAIIDIACKYDLPPATEPYPWGAALPLFGALQYDALVLAIDHALAGDVHAICTLPLHKKRFIDAGLLPTGHTEILAHRCDASATMVLAGDVLRVALATTHLPLRQVADSLTIEGLVSTMQDLASGLADLGFIAADTVPHIAVCGLNPHAGEEGVMGREEIDIITPAIERANALPGMSVSGPWPADTLFPRVVHGEMQADIVLAMYHDQGLGPLKTAHHHKAANITFGLPIIRTSVDHGTAYDIAGTATASTASFVYAFELAARLRRPQPNR
jgi:4-hydroxythreonine-4-phosphate dehydrogenase